MMTPLLEVLRLAAVVLLALMALVWLLAEVVLSNSSVLLSFR
jgi:hypothetical protein